jgi:hypothetical protein
MITYKGKEIISKYMLGQVPAYASYISFGCGAEPGEDVPNGSEQQMKFEMFRIPISSRSLVGDQISFTAEIPFEPRYRITEVGLWSDATNALTNSDSRIIFSFVDAENWKVYDADPNVPIAIPIVSESLSGKALSDEDGIIRTAEEVFWCDASNQTLTWKTDDWPNSYDRRQEGARFLNQTLFVRSDTQKKIYIDGRRVDLSQNSSQDILTLALALHNVNPESPNTTNYTSIPTVNIKFMRDPANNDAGFATFSVPIDKMHENGTDYKLYQVIEQKLDDITYSPNFTWQETRWVEITIENGDPNWYIALDAMRFDNVSTPNPIYVMSGYTVAADILNKVTGTNSYIEYRFSLETAVSTGPARLIGGS